MGGIIHHIILDNTSTMLSIIVIVALLFAASGELVVYMCRFTLGHARTIDITEKVTYVDVRACNLTGITLRLRKPISVSLY